MIANELKNIIEGEVSTDPKDIELYSKDASIFKVKPEVVVYPKSSQDTQKLVKWVGENKKNNSCLSLTARGGGTDMSGGPLNESIILDFTRYMNRFEIESNPTKSFPSNHGAGSVITQPGVYYRDFKREADQKNLLFPSYPASWRICAMGGIVANNAGGEKSLIYGKTEDYVKELKVVLSDGNEYSFGPVNADELEQKKSLQNFEGEIYRSTHQLIESNYDLIQKAKPDVSKNSAGYYLWNVWNRQTFDLTKLFVGSQGTLGIITEAKLKLVAPKQNTSMLVIFLNDIKPLGDVITSVLKYNPSSLESYDDKTFSVAMRFLSQLVGQLRGNLITLFFKFIPEMLMVLTGGVPKIILIAEFEGDDKDSLREVAQKAQKVVSDNYKLKTRVITKESEAEKYWAVRRESFSLLRKHAGNKHTAPFIDDIAVHPRQLSEFLPKISKLIEEYPGLIYTIAGHAGDANFHIIPIMDFHKPENRQAITELSEKVYNLVGEMHGSITAEHNDGIVRTPYLDKMYSLEILELFRKTKKIFDPQNIFNPGKKVGGSIEYLERHVVKE